MKEGNIEGPRPGILASLQDSVQLLSGESLSVLQGPRKLFDMISLLKLFFLYL